MIPHLQTQTLLKDLLHSLFIEGGAVWRRGDAEAQRTRRHDYTCNRH